MGRIMLAALSAAAIIAVPATTTALGKGYRGAFVVHDNPHTFGQAPAFMPDGRVVSNEDLGDGSGTQLYVAGLDGSGQKCLTCGETAPN
ncbi:MAG: hypothetical protein QOG68_141, partial [Solirubrobacteraceae bacterium]|nr:hypothetical protein [Solirubrobacteraceae bacterium]